MSNLLDKSFNTFFRKQLETNNFNLDLTARITAEHRDRLAILTSSGEYSLKKYFSEKLKDQPKVGDWVLLSTNPAQNHDFTIDRILERKTILSRSVAGDESKEQVIAVNIDTVFIVTGLDGNFNLNRIERYLALVWSSGANPVIILNKSDLCDDLDSILFDVEMRSPGVDVIVCNKHETDTVQKVLEYIPEGSTAAFVGSSGVGKSTIINLLSGSEKMITNEVREGDSRGRHTTTHRQMIFLPNGGTVIDTPGMREIQLADDEGIDSAFPEFIELSEYCRFRDCQHISEPGCAVKEAVDTGEIPVERYNNYLKLVKETESYEIRQNEHLRRKNDQKMGKLRKDVDLIHKMKRKR